MAPLEARVGDPKGLNVQSLVHAIEQHYRTVEGQRVKVTVGTGVDGLPRGFIYMEETDGV